MITNGDLIRAERAVRQAQERLRQHRFALDGARNNRNVAETQYRDADRRLRDLEAQTDLATDGVRSAEAEVQRVRRELEQERAQRPAPFISGGVGYLPQRRRGQGGWYG